MAKNVCEVLLDILAPVSTRQIFGMTGDALNPFLDAIRRDGRFEWMGIRHEETGAFAASAQAKLSGKLAVCAGTVGPGALHLINGLYDAKRDRAPVLAITGHVPLSEQGTDFFQETNLKAIFEDICVYNQYVNSASQMPRVAQQAVQIALTKGGVAHLSIPTDVIKNEVPRSDLSREIINPESTVIPCPSELEKIANVLNKGNKIAILAGDGCRGARDELLAVAKKLNAPIVRTLRGTDVMEYDNPYWIGGLGMLGSTQGLVAMEACDTMLMIGSDFPYSMFLPSSKEIIQIDIRAAHLGKRCPVTHGVVGHVKPTLTALEPMLQQQSDSAFLNDIQSRREKWDVRMDKKADPLRGKKGIPPQAVTRMACDLADDDAVFIADVGEITAWSARHLRIRGKQRLLGSFNHGSVGVAVPSSMGVQALDKSRQVVALAGDGGFGMMMQDLITAVRYELPVTFVIYNNSKLGFIELEMLASGLPTYGTKLVNPNFVAYAEACGAKGRRVEKGQDLEEAILEAYASKSPYVLDVVVNPNELIPPPKIQPAHAWGYSLAKLKEIFIEDDQV